MFVENLKKEGKSNHKTNVSTKILISTDSYSQHN